MIVGVPKEIKDHENRVAITPAGVEALVQHGHAVLIETGAGVQSGFSDERYAAAGAEVVDTAKAVFAKAEMIVKVKEPQPSEYELIEERHTVFTYFHFASDRGLTEAMAERKAACIAYETVQLADGSLPLLAPMSEIAGKVAMDAGIHYLEEPNGGKGKLLSPIPGVRPGSVMILGAGIAGCSSMRMAAGLGCMVYLLDINLNRLRHLAESAPPNVFLVHSNTTTIREILPKADVVIGAVLVPGARTPILIRDDMLDTMEKGSVIADIAVDQGGCIETCKPTTHSNPTYTHKGIIHYCVANMPGAVSQTSTIALTNATMPYMVELADKGWKRAIEENPALAHGLNMRHGRVHCQGVAEAFDMEYVPLSAA